MFWLALLLATARERLVESAQHAAPSIKVWGGRVLLGVGVWFIALGIFADFFAEVFSV